MRAHLRILDDPDKLKHLLLILLHLLLHQLLILLLILLLHLLIQSKCQRVKTRFSTNVRQMFMGRFYTNYEMITVKSLSGVLAYNHFKDLRQQWWITLRPGETFSAHVPIHHGCPDPISSIVHEQGRVHWPIIVKSPKFV